MYCHLDRKMKITKQFYALTFCFRIENPIGIDIAEIER